MKNNTKAFLYASIVTLTASTCWDKPAPIKPLKASPNLESKDSPTPVEEKTEEAEKNAAEEVKNAPNAAEATDLKRIEPTTNKVNTEPTANTCPIENKVTEGSAFSVDTNGVAHLTTPVFIMQPNGIAHTTYATDPEAIKCGINKISENKADEVDGKPTTDKPINDQNISWIRKRLNSISSWFQTLGSVW